MPPNPSTRFALPWKVLPLLVAMLALVQSAEANSKGPPCMSAASAWASSCAASQKIEIAPLHCASLASLPWHLIGALGATLFVASSLLRRSRPSRGLLTTAALLALGIGTWAFRRLAIPSAFFHQNGHGAMWVECALGGRCTYGGGFRELFGFAAQVDPGTAEQGVFFANSLLAATGPISAWLIARAVGAPRVLAWSIALVLAMDPGLGRLAGSESYYGVVTWLFLWAAALIATGARLGGPRSTVFLIATIGAGTLIGQAVAIHPIAWVPSALVPLSAFLGPGSLRRRAGLLLVGTLGSGLVASISSGKLVLDVYRAHQQWATSLGGGFLMRLLSLNPSTFISVVALLGGGGALYRLHRRQRLSLPTRRWALRAAVLVLVVMVCELLNPVHHLPPWIQHAWWGPYLPSIIAALAALLANSRRRPLSAKLLGASIIVTGIAFSVSSWHRLLALPTDALEARFASSWRELLPDGARVLHLERADKRITTLPIFRTAARDIQLVVLSSANIERASSIAAMSGAYYHRSSLCSTDEGRAICDTLESKLKLEPVSVAAFPALPSMPHMLYDADSVRVGLYRIVNSAEPTP